MALTSRKKRPLDHSVPHLRDASIIVIATEGAKTEGQYFDLFGSKRVQIHVLPTEEGFSAPKHVFARLAEFKKECDIGKDDQLWLMIDVDRWEERSLAEVASESLRKKFQLAVSNPCFELWLYLHHGDVDSETRVTCNDLKEQLKAVLGSYNKSKLDLDRYRGKESDAISRARALDADSDQRWPNATGTHVYKVVEEVLALMDK
jgi:hypothetical protein